MAETRRIATYALNQRCAKVFTNPDWGEYIVKFYINGVRQTGADYHDSDRSSAIQTASHWVNQLQPDEA